MKKVLLNLLFLCASALALASCVSANSAKPADKAKARTSCPNDLFREATGTGKDIDEASAKAKAKIASDIIFQAETRAEIDKRKEKDSEQRITTSSSFSTKSEVNSPLTTLYGFKKMEPPRQLEDGEYEFRGYVCNSDAARSYLKSLQNYRDSLKVLKMQKNVCGKAREVRKNMRDFEIILEVLEQVDKSLQKEYENVYAEIENDCGLEASKKIHWNPEKKTAYSDIAFSKLSASIEMEKSSCPEKSKSKDISLIYKGTEPECKAHGGPYGCSYQPSMLIVSCGGETLKSLESPTLVRGFDGQKEIAEKKLQEKLNTENFWNEWKQEIKQWSPQ